MRRIPNPELDTVILEHLAQKYQLLQSRGPGEFHLSSAVYCLTKAYWEATAPIPPTVEESLLFAIGLGLQDIMTPKGAETPKFEKDGVIYRPDFVLSINDSCAYHELKTTRMSLKHLKESLPDTWVEYIAGGCFIRGVNSYELSTLLLMGTYAPPFPLLYSETLEFSDTELAENWSNILRRKEVYMRAIETQIPPEPFQWSKDWESKNCRYKTICDAVVMMKRQAKIGRDIKELF